MINFFKKHIKGIRDYTKWLFRKPEIYFGKKPTGKDIMQMVKDQNLYGLRDVLPKNIMGRKVSRLQSLGIISIFGIGIILSIAMGNPLPFLIGLGIAYGSEYVFNAGATAYISVSALDSTHFVVAYQDDGGSDYGMAIVGTISGTPTDDIAYGSEYVFNEGITRDISVSKLDSTHFVVGYYSASTGFAYCQIGTVSNTDVIGYGSKYDFNGNSLYISLSALDATHFVVAYQDNAGDSYGMSKIGVISDTDVIAYGSEYTFNSVRTLYISVSKLDSTHFVVAYNNDYTYGMAKVGKIS